MSSCSMQVHATDDIFGRDLTRAGWLATAVNEPCHCATPVLVLAVDGLRRILTVYGCETQTAHSLNSTGS